HQNFSTAETVYGVATKSFSLSDVNRNWPNVGLSFTLGYGNGLFKNDGGLGSAYAKHSTGGVFGGAKVEFYPSSRSAVSLMFENNAWDYNLGAVLNYRGSWRGCTGRRWVPGARAIHRPRHTITTSLRSRWGGRTTYWHCCVVISCRNGLPNWKRSARRCSLKWATGRSGSHPCSSRLTGTRHRACLNWKHGGRRLNRN